MSTQLPPSDHSQFRLSREHKDTLPGWQTQQAYGWVLSRNPALPVSTIRTASGDPLGWLLGYWTDLRTGEFSPPYLTIPVEHANDLTPELVDQELAHLGGRFAAVVLTETQSTFHPDASGSLCALYHLNRPLLASTPDLVSRPDPSAPPLDPSIEISAQGTGTWYPAGFTPRHDVHVVLANHYLDLSSWTLKRVWPREEIPRIPGSRHAAAALETIASSVRVIIQAIQNRYPITLNLTAGRDSRMLLAITRDIAGGIEFHTRSEYHQLADAVLAKRIAQYFSLTHTVALRPDPGRVLLQGLAGEVGRAFYWRKKDRAQEPLTGAELAERLGFVSSRPLIARLDQWLSPLRIYDRFLILDLAYIELRLACAMGPAMYQHDEKCIFAAYPMNSRSVFQAMLSLPVRYRQQQGLFRDILLYCWPELLRFPVNKQHFTGVRRYVNWSRWVVFGAGLTPVQREVMRLVTTGGQSLGRMLLDDCRRGWGKIVRRLRVSQQHTRS